MKTRTICKALYTLRKIMKLLKITKEIQTIYFRIFNRKHKIKKLTIAG
jgi:hypothetical protein